MLHIWLRRAAALVALVALPLAGAQSAPRLPVDTVRNVVELEAAPRDISLTTQGPRQRITFVDESVLDDPQLTSSKYLALFSSAYGDTVTVPPRYVAAQVDASGRVTRMVNPSVDGKVPAWEAQPIPLPIPDGGYVVIAFDTSYANEYYKRFLATALRVGDTVRLRLNGEVSELPELIGDGPRPGLRLTTSAMFTTADKLVKLGARVLNYSPDKGYSVRVNGAAATLTADGRVSYNYVLRRGTNYVDFELWQAGAVVARRSVVVYHKPQAAKQVLLWIEQGNLRRFQDAASIRRMLLEAQGAGVTGIAIDVKGYEGYASYQRTTRTGRPYVSAIRNPTKAGANPNLDFLGVLVAEARQLGLTVHASMNVFGEGSMNEAPILEAHPDWEEQVLRAEDRNRILPIRQSAAPGKIVAFVNPQHPGARAFQLDTAREILENYDVDGIVLDRARYDGAFADFSDESRRGFEAYLARIGKRLDRWPGDVYSFSYDAQGAATRVEGPLFLDWWAYRSGVIRDFVKDVRALVNDVNRRYGRQVQLSQYVGSWYETLFENGLNWASLDWKYDPRLAFPESRIYGDAYAQTSYLDQLDFIMIGSYQDTLEGVERAVTLGNILTGGRVPLYASLALNNVQEPRLQRQVAQSALRYADGLMLFEYSLANFPIIAASVRDREYVRDELVGVSNPKEPENPLSADFVNTNRNEENTNVFTSSFGPTTGTSTFGVEVVVGADGRVTAVKNGAQAREWNFAQPEDNNSAIPQGGFVVSALDRSGVRVRRQQLANLFAPGDEVRAARLIGLLALEAAPIPQARIELQGRLETLGPGSRLELRLNGTVVPLQVGGAFSVPLELHPGANALKVEAWVDGKKVIGRTLTLTRQ
ncbi:hypothetical protein HNR42_001294 [Deinobacterium chartae]|uniref:Glycosyl hydrolase-like 10 domain-containing protein n=1 Tax=Deinobacterium chartae TaxID=521158 RepID=A0A841HWG6_9DEIO|nr:family 10 glycosylhydrolase [Deinobacterium chartae]MBB6097871.1 hypothetical protein [Deinobacterium chartae]